VRHYRGGIDGWKEAGGPVEGSLASASACVVGSERMPAYQESAGFRLRASSAARPWGNALLDIIERFSTGQLFVIWLGIMLLCGGIYWLADFSHSHGLIERGGSYVDASLAGLLTAIYFSFVTATSVGYGDVLPLGWVRMVAIAEAVTGLLIFGAVVAKFVSRRQEELVREIHRITFEDRLDRVQTNLHLVLSELQTIRAICAEGAITFEQVGARLESAVLVFAGELRTIHDLLYEPQHSPDEPVLAAILASLASSLRTLSELLVCLPPDFRRTSVLDATLQTLSGLAEDICAECVPQAYAPALTEWMDRIQETARKIA
jgi:Ion channel